MKTEDLKLINETIKKLKEIRDDIDSKCNWDDEELIHMIAYIKGSIKNIERLKNESIRSTL